MKQKVCEGKEHCANLMIASLVRTLVIHDKKLKEYEFDTETVSSWKHAYMILTPLNPTFI